MYRAQSEANYKDLLFNKIVQQTSFQAIYICIFVMKTHQCGLLINLKMNTQVVHADSKLLCLPTILLWHN